MVFIIKYTISLIKISQKKTYLISHWLEDSYGTMVLRSTCNSFRLYVMKTKLRMACPESIRNGFWVTKTEILKSIDNILTAGKGSETSFWHYIKHNFPIEKAILVSDNHGNSSFLRQSICYLSLHYSFAM